MSISRRMFLKLGAATGASAALGAKCVIPEPAEAEDVAEIVAHKVEEMEAEIALLSSTGQLYGRMPITLEGVSEDGPVIWRPKEDPIIFPQADSDWGLITAAVIFANGRNFHLPVQSPRYVSYQHHAQLADMWLEQWGEEL